MRKTLAALAACLAFVGTAEAAPKAGGEYRLRVADIMDPTGFERPMRAATIVIPADWKADGGVVYDFNDQCITGSKTAWTATSADGKAAIAILPNFGWAMDNMGTRYPQGCVPQAFQNAEQVAAYYVSQFPGGRVTRTQRDPQADRQLGQMGYVLQGDPYMATAYDYVDTYFTYTENGVPYEGVLTVLSTHNYMQSGQSMVYMTGMPPMEAVTGQTLAVMGYSAPKGEFNEGVYRMAMTNFQTDPQWLKRVMQVQAKAGKVSSDEARKRSKIISDTYSDISDMQMDSWKRQQASSDYMGRETSEMIRGVETFTADTPTGQIELPSGYGSAWQLNDGSFVVTDDAFYDPWRDSGQEGTRLGVAD